MNTLSEYNKFTIAGPQLNPIVLLLLVLNTTDFLKK